MYQLPAGLYRFFVDRDAQYCAAGIIQDTDPHREPVRRTTGVGRQPRNRAEERCRDRRALETILLRNGVQALPIAALGAHPIGVKLDQISSCPRTWTWAWTSAFSRPVLSLGHSECLMQGVAGFLRLPLRDKHQSKSTSRSKYRLERAKELRAQVNACGVHPCPPRSDDVS